LIGMVSFMMIIDFLFILISKVRTLLTDLLTLSQKEGR
jgi:hypothetical protein